MAVDLFKESGVKNGGQMTFLNFFYWIILNAAFNALAALWILRWHVRRNTGLKKLYVEQTSMFVTEALIVFARSWFAASFTLGILLWLPKWMGMNTTAIWDYTCLAASGYLGYQLAYNHPAWNMFERFISSWKIWVVLIWGVHAWSIYSFFDLQKLLQVLSSSMRM